MKNRHARIHQKNPQRELFLGVNGAPPTALIKHVSSIAARLSQPPTNHTRADLKFNEYLTKPESRTGA